MTGSLNIMASVAFKGLLERIGPEYRQGTNFGFAPTYAPAGIVVRRVRAGTASDLVVVTPDSWKALAGEGLVVPGSEHNVATSVIGVAVRAGAAKPKIDTADDLRNKMFKHPLMGELDGYQAVLVIAAHPQRHAMQIEEIKATDSYKEVAGNE